VGQHPNKGQYVWSFHIGAALCCLVRRGCLFTGAVQPLGVNQLSAEIAPSLLTEKELNGDVAVCGVALDRRRMHIAAGLKPHLTLGESLSYVRFPGCLDNDFRIAHHDANRVKFMPCNCTES